MLEGLSSNTSSFRYLSPRHLSIVLWLGSAPFLSFSKTMEIGVFWRRYLDQRTPRRSNYSSQHFRVICSIFITNRRYLLNNWEFFDSFSLNYRTSQKSILCHSWFFRTILSLQFMKKMLKKYKVRKLSKSAITIKYVR